MKTGEWVGRTVYGKQCKILAHSDNLFQNKPMYFIEKNKCKFLCDSEIQIDQTEPRIKDCIQRGEFPLYRAHRCFRRPQYIFGWNCKEISEKNMYIITGVCGKVSSKWRESKISSRIFEKSLMWEFLLMSRGDCMLLCE